MDSGGHDARNNRGKGEMRDELGGGGGIKNSSRKSKRGRIESAPGRTCQKVNERKIDGQWEVNELERGGRLYTGGAFFFFLFTYFLHLVAILC